MWKTFELYFQTQMTQIVVSDDVNHIFGNTKIGCFMIFYALINLFYF